MLKEYEELKAKIVKANPSIMELEFGYEIMVNNITKDRCIISSYNFYQDKTFQAECLEHKNGHWTFDKKDAGKDFEIIGRPITLEDVLIFLRSNNINNVACDVKGEIFTVNTRNYFRITNWLLGKTLDQQTDETIRELNKIIN